MQPIAGEYEEAMLDFEAALALSPLDAARHVQTSPTLTCSGHPRCHDRVRRAEESPGRQGM